ncbi:MAG: alpha/beta fold hydrolase [Rhodoferax sp.]
MSEPTLNYVSCADGSGGHRMAYWVWGAPQAAHTIVCVHGLSRQGRDFDALAQTLLQRSQGTVRVLCPDVVGRGHSDWLGDPQGYQLPTYVADMAALLRQEQCVQVDWVGTSMGGLIGMVVAVHAPAWGTKVGRLVLNDVGPVLQWPALERIAQYLGHDPVFANEDEAADALWADSQGFGPHTRAQWLALTRPMLRPRGDGTLRLHYDPALALPVRALLAAGEPTAPEGLWQTYDAIQAQTLLLRGAQSDLLSAQTARDMAARGPRAHCITFEGVGHAPTLIAPDQVDAVCAFLIRP